MITCKGLVKMITLFLDDGLLILSIESTSNHDPSHLKNPKIKHEILVLNDFLS